MFGTKWAGDGDMYSYYSIFAHKKLLKWKNPAGVLQENGKCGIIQIIIGEYVPFAAQTR
jgi:hypothetical protein